jgi:hypothetical protein
MTAEFWFEMLENFEHWFRTAVGSPQKLAEWLHGIGPMRGAVG